MINMLYKTENGLAQLRNIKADQKKQMYLYIRPEVLICL